MVYGSGHAELQPCARVSLIKEARGRGFTRIEATRGTELVV
jgi:hypothetical protein